MSGLSKFGCEKCNKTLFHGNIIEGTISKDCPKCGHRNVIVVSKAEVEVKSNVAAVPQMTRR